MMGGGTLKEDVVCSSTPWGSLVSYFFMKIFIYIIYMKSQETEIFYLQVHSQTQTKIGAGLGQSQEPGHSIQASQSGIGYPKLTHHLCFIGHVHK